LSNITKSWLIKVGFAFGIFSFVFFTRPRLDWVAANDGFFIVSAVFLALVGLKWVGDEGTFDVVSYSLTKLGDSLKKDSVKSFKDPYEYQKFKEPQRVKSRKTYGSYLIIALIAVALTILSSFFI
jgi:hypothetical protein